MIKQEERRVLAVDDSRGIREIIKNVVGTIAETTVVPSGSDALLLLDGGKEFDLFLLDVSMPEMDGYDLINLFKRHPYGKGVPVIFLTAHTDKSAEEKGLRQGAVDYITKPISPPTLLARVKNHLDLKKARDLIASHNLVLEQRVQERTREIELTQDAAIFSLASLAETRDNETGNHIRRTQRYVRLLADQLLEDGMFSGQLCLECNTLMEKSAALHDIGKVGIPDSILLKPAGLTPEEFEVMKSHARLGFTALESAEGTLGSTSFLRYAKEISLGHHEKWDGSGYPNGVAGDDIPLSARLMALADVYDALISKRHYKPAFPHEKAVRIILEGRGRHFDPRVVDAFSVLADQFDTTATQLGD